MSHAIIAASLLTDGSVKPKAGGRIPTSEAESLIFGEFSAAYDKLSDGVQREVLPKPDGHPELLTGEQENLASDDETPRVKSEDGAGQDHSKARKTEQAVSESSPNVGRMNDTDASDAELSLLSEKSADATSVRSGDGRSAGVGGAETVGAPREAFRIETTAKDKADLLTQPPNSGHRNGADMSSKIVGIGRMVLSDQQFDVEQTRSGQKVSLHQASQPENPSMHHATLHKGAGQLADVHSSRQSRTASIDPPSTEKQAVPVETQKQTHVPGVPEVRGQDQRSKHRIQDRQVSAATVGPMPAHAATVAATAPKTVRPAQPAFTLLQTSETALSKDATALAGLDPELAPFEARSATSTSAQQMATGNPIPHGAQTARHIAAQIQDAVKLAPDKPVSISLNPEELGRVRMSISATEGGVVLYVLAERPETLDLMKRHIDLLAKEFGELGFSSVDLAFGQGSEGSTDGSQDNPDADTRHLALDHAIRSEAGAEAVQRVWHRSDGSLRVDIRI